MNFDAKGRFKVDNDNDKFYGALQIHAGNDQGLLKKLEHACQHIEKNMPLAISIDNFIDSERENAELTLCAKMAIVYSILEAERESKLLRNNIFYV